MQTQKTASGAAILVAEQSQISVLKGKIAPSGYTLFSRGYRALIKREVWQHPTKRDNLGFMGIRKQVVQLIGINNEDTYYLVDAVPEKPSMAPVARLCVNGSVDINGLEELELFSERREIIRLRAQSSAAKGQGNEESKAKKGSSYAT